MCAAVVLKDGQRLYTVREVETLTGFVFGRPDDACLCCVDAGDALDFAGIPYEVDSIWGDFLTDASLRTTGGEK